MTAEDRKYMVDVDDANLTAFLAWHDDARRRGALNVSFYAILKMCWMAARNAPAEAELPPSRDVLEPLPPARMAYSPEGNRELREEPFRAPAPRPEPPRRRSFNPEFELRGTPTGRLRVPEPPLQPLPPANWPQRSPDAHREAQRFVETQAMPALRPHFEPEPYAVDAEVPDPFANVRLSGLQQAALDRMYPEPGFTTMELPIVGPVESVSGHRRVQMEARYAGLRDFGPPGPVMTPLQALPEPGDG